MCARNNTTTEKTAKKKKPTATTLLKKTIVSYSEIPEPLESWGELYHWHCKKKTFFSSCVATVNEGQMVDGGNMASGIMMRLSTDEVDGTSHNEVDDGLCKSLRQSLKPWVSVKNFVLTCSSDYYIIK